MGLDAICNATLLSQNREAGFKFVTFKSFSKPKILVTSQVVDAIALYSTLAKDLDIVLCFLLSKNQ